MTRRRVRWLATAGILLLALASTVFAYEVQKDSGPVVPLPFSVFAHEVQVDNIGAVSTVGDQLSGSARTPVSVVANGSTTTSTAFVTVLPTFGDPGLTDALKSDGATVNPAQASYGWDIVAAAPSLSTLAAILAGFVLIAIVSILTNKPTGKISPYDPLHPLLTAFLTLVAASFLYAVLAGDGVSGGTQLAPLAQGYVISWLFAFGVLQTAVGIAWLLKDYDVGPEVVGTAWWLVQATVVILAASLSGILVQPLFVLHPETAGQDSAFWIGTAVVSVAAIGVGILLYRHDSKSGETEEPSAPALRSLKRLTPWVLILTVIALGSFGVLSVIPEETVRTGSRVVLTCLAAGQAAFALLIMWYEKSLPIDAAQPSLRDTATRVRPA